MVVFLPLGLLSGVAGQFFAALSISLSVAVVLSLPVALGVLPSLAARWLRPVRRASAGARLSGKYGSALQRALARPGLVLILALVLTAAGALLGARLPTDFLPEADEGSYVVDYFAPVGASLADADALASRLEGVLRDTPEVAAFARRLGTELGPPVATLPSRGDIAVRLKDGRNTRLRGDRGRSARQDGGARARPAHRVRAGARRHAGRPAGLARAGGDQASSGPTRRCCGGWLTTLPGAPATSRGWSTDSRATKAARPS